MVDWLRSGTKAAETIMGGMAGGIAFSLISDGLLPPREIGILAIVTVILMALFITAHWYYERRRGEPFR